MLDSSGTCDLDALDSIDIEAIQIVRAWGVQNGHKEWQWTYTPCPRLDCGGAIVSGFSDACILCARIGGQDAQPAPSRRRRNGRD